MKLGTILSRALQLISMLIPSHAWLLLGLSLICGIFFAWYSSSSLLVQSWPTTRGLIEISEIREFDPEGEDSAFYIHLEYSYSVSHEAYRSNRIYPGTLYTHEGKVDREGRGDLAIVRDSILSLLYLDVPVHSSPHPRELQLEAEQFPVGEPVLVYYNPEKPQQAVLRAEITQHHYRFILLAIVCLVFAFISTFFYWVGRGLKAAGMKLKNLGRLAWFPFLLGLLFLWLAFDAWWNYTDPVPRELSFQSACSETVSRGSKDYVRIAILSHPRTVLFPSGLHTPAVSLCDSAEIASPSPGSDFGELLGCAVHVNEISGVPEAAIFEVGDSEYRALKTSTTLGENVYILSRPFPSKEKLLETFGEQTSFTGKLVKLDSALENRWWLKQVIGNEWNSILTTHAGLTSSAGKYLLLADGALPAPRPVDAALLTIGNCLLIEAHDEYERLKSDTEFQGYLQPIFPSHERKLSSSGVHLAGQSVRLTLKRIDEIRAENSEKAQSLLSLAMFLLGVSVVPRFFLRKLKV